MRGWTTLGSARPLQRGTVALVGCFTGAIVVQALLVAFYAAVAREPSASTSHRGTWRRRACVVPRADAAALGQRLGLREATFSFYFARLGLQSRRRW
jgi:hypothetical protein